MPDKLIRVEVEMELDANIRESGFIDIPVDTNIDLVSEIRKLKKEKKAIILGPIHQATIVVVLVHVKCCK